MNSEIINNLESAINSIEQFEKETNTSIRKLAIADIDTLIDQLSEYTIDECDIDLVLESHDEIFEYCIKYSDNKSINDALQYVQLVISEFDSEIRFIDINEYL